MKLKTVRARQGLEWVRGGWRVFLRQPLGFSALFALAGLAVLLLAQLPLVGPVLALGLMPPATAGFLLASREALAGRGVHPGLMIRPLREPAARRALIQLGMVYAVAAIAVVLLAHLLDGGRFVEVLEAAAENRLTGEMLDGTFQLGLMLRLLLLTALSLLFWHAPALVWWHGLSTAKALFASLVACGRAFGAFAVYALAWFALLVMFTMVTQVIFAMLGLAQAAAQAVLPAVMLFSTVFYASLYFSYVDSFEVDEATD
jgi:hypothetical protein